MRPSRTDLDALRKIATGDAYRAATENLNPAIVWRGTPSTPRAKVAKLEFDGSVATVQDCPSQGTLRPYYVETGKPVPVQSNTVPPPYGVTARVTRTSTSWLVTNVTTDTSKTCAP
jgi:hypothetical protein